MLGAGTPAGVCWRLLTLCCRPPPVQAEADEAEAACRASLEQVEGQLAELEAQLALGDLAAGASASRGAASAGA